VRLRARCPSIAITLREVAGALMFGLLAVAVTLPAASG
jgi:hypothetical protein